jgi:hypothetical protein
MALGVSDDWINQDIARRCYALAKFLFITGISLMCFTVVLVVLSYLLPTFVRTSLGFVFAWSLGLFVACVVAVKLVSGRKRMPPPKRMLSP